jgi:hypothetical protein
MQVYEFPVILGTFTFYNWETLLDMSICLDADCVCLVCGILEQTTLCNYYTWCSVLVVSIVVIDCPCFSIVIFVLQQDDPCKDSSLFMSLDMPQYSLINLNSYPYFSYFCGIYICTWGIKLICGLTGAKREVVLSNMPGKTTQEAR